MKNFLKKFIVYSLITSTFAGFAAVSFPQTTYAETYAECVARVSNQQNPEFSTCNTLRDAPVDAAAKNGGTDPNDPGFWVRHIIQPGVAWVVTIILKLVSLLTGLGGLILNGVVFYTIVDVKNNYDKITGIEVAWKAIRDIGNMGFIFVLLYASIMTIIGKGEDNQKLIVKIIVVAVLINFSLFFTKVIIDISNVLALTFYESIVPGALQKGLTYGLANAFMQYLDLTSLYKVTGGNTLGIDQIITIGLMGSVLLLIAAFIFFAVSIMLVIRFVVLILVLILSPIAFLSFVLPEMGKYRGQWKDALIGQAFFAPIYFMLTWVTLNILGGIMKKEIFGTPGPISTVSSASINNMGSVSGGSFVSTFINFAVVIAFLIISLVLSKEWASKTPGGVGKLTSWATGKAGSASFGLVGKLGRETVGAAADRATQSKGFQQWAGRSFVGQKLYQATGKAAQSSFDLRATKIGDATVGNLSAGNAQSGGFKKALQEKIEKREKFANTLNDKTAKQNYANRVSSGPLTQGGSRSSSNTIFGTLGRHNRIFASKLLSDQITKIKTDLNSGNSELTRYQNIINQYTTAHPGTTAAAAPGLALNPNQLVRYNTLNGAVGTPGSLSDMQDKINNLETQIERNGLTNLTPAQIAANSAARAAGTPPPHKGTKSNEQNF